MEDKSVAGYHLVSGYYRRLIVNMVRDIKDNLTTDAIISVFDYVGYDLDYPDGRKALDTFLKMKDLVFSNTTDDVSFGPISVSIDVYQICD